jgi:hypothetical protein
MIKIGVVVWASLAVASSFAQLVEPSPQVSISSSVTLKVPKYSDAVASIRRSAEAHEGTVLGSSSQTNEKGGESGWIRLSVGSDQLAGLLGEVKALGKVFGERSTRTDHRNEIDELRKRSERLAEHTARLRGVLSGDKRMRGSDILFLQDRLLRATLDHDLLDLATEKLAHSGKQATVNLILFEPSNERLEGGESFGSQVKHRFQTGGRDLVQGVAGFLLWLVEKLLYVLILVPVYLIARKTFLKGGRGDRVKKFLVGEEENP